MPDRYTLTCWTRSERTKSSIGLVKPVESRELGLAEGRKWMVVEAERLDRSYFRYYDDVNIGYKVVLDE